MNNKKITITVTIKINNVIRALALIAVFLTELYNFIINKSSTNHEGLGLVKCGISVTDFIL